jgi:hypothetical protein
VGRPKRENEIIAAKEDNVGYIEDQASENPHGLDIGESSVHSFLYLILSRRLFITFSTFLSTGIAA